MSVLWRVGNVDFCMHFGGVICTCLHSKCWRQHCLHYYVRLFALAARHFGIGRQKKMSDEQDFLSPYAVSTPWHKLVNFIC